MHKILVIDDNSDVLEMLRVALEVEGYQVMVADSGISALTKIQETEPDLLLLDYSMPDINGIDVARKARSFLDDLPIIFITAHSSLVEKAVDILPKATILPKPFMLGTLSHRVTAMLQKPVS